MPSVDVWVWTFVWRGEVKLNVNLVDRRRVRVLMTLDQAYEKWRAYLDYIKRAPGIPVICDTERSCPFGSFVQALRKRGYSVV